MRLIATAIVLLAPVVLTQPVHAQEPVPDTTSAWRYFPLEVGNVWEYEGYGPLTPEDHRWEVVGDTLLEGRHYFAAIRECISECFPTSVPTGYLFRFDSTAARVVVRYPEDVPGTEYLFFGGGCALDAPFGAEAACYESDLDVSGGYDETFELADGGVLEGVTYKVFGTPTVYWGYVAGIGLVEDAFLEYEPRERRLAYARIGGVEYGTPIPVAAEGAPPQSAVALAVFPNPSRGEATVRLDLDVTQRVVLAVYDVLGRRVALLHVGPLPAGDHRFLFDASALSAGTYFVRSTGTGGTTTTPFTLSR